MGVGAFEAFKMFGSFDLRGGENVNKQLDGIDKKSGKTAKFFKGIGKTVAVAGAAFVAFGAVVGGKAVKAAESFEIGMANVSTLLGGDVTKRIGELKGNVQDLMQTTGLSAEVLQDGLYQTISAFGDTADSMGILETASKGATAGNATVTDSVNLLSAVMKGYGDVSQESADKASDLAFLTVKLGQTTFPELASSMGKVIPMAGALNVSQEELFGSMATLTGVTGNTAEVSTQLRGTLQGLMKPSANMTKALEKLGYESGAAALEELGLQGTLDALGDTVDDDQIKLAGLWGSVEAGTAVIALTGSQAKNFTEKTKAMGDAVGATEEAFVKQSGTFKASMARMKETINVNLVKIGERLLPVVEKLMKSLMKIVPPLMDFIVPLIDKLMPVIEVITTKLLPVFLGLLDAFLPVLDPIIDIFMFLIDNALLPLIDLLLPLIKQIMPVFIKLLDMLIPILKPLLAAFFTLVEALLPPLITVVLKLVEAFMPLIDAVLPIIVELLDIMMPIWLLLIDALLWMVDKVLPLVIAYWTWIAEKVFPLVLNALKKVKPVIDNIVKWFRELPAKIPGIIEDLKAKMAAVWDRIKWYVEKIFIQIRGGILTKFYNIRDGIKDIGTKIKDAANLVFDNVKTGITTRIETARDTVKKVIDKIKGFFKFSLKLPKIKLPKMPKFTLKGAFNWMSKSVPKIGINWKAKGAVLNRPTIFGMNGNELMGGGERGKEAVAPIETLQQYIKTAVNDANGGSPNIVINVNDAKLFNMDDGRKLANLIYNRWKALGVGTP